MGPLRGDGNNNHASGSGSIISVEKMGPLRGDGNINIQQILLLLLVEKMGPLRGDGNLNI